jgi:hypothetical protein
MFEAIQITSFRKSTQKYSNSNISQRIDTQSAYASQTNPNFNSA